MNKSRIIFRLLHSIFSQINSTNRKKTTKKIFQNAKLSIASYCCAFGHWIIMFVHTHKVPLCSVLYIIFFSSLHSIVDYYWKIDSHHRFFDFSLPCACEIITQLNFKSDIFKWLNMSKKWKHCSLFCSLFTIYLKLNWVFHPWDISHFTWISVVTKFFEMKSIKLIQCQLNLKRNWRRRRRGWKRKQYIHAPMNLTFYYAFVWDSSQNRLTREKGRERIFF